MSASKCASQKFCLTGDSLIYNVKIREVMAESSARSDRLATGSRIDFSDDHSWYREWKKPADASHQRGNDARGRGNLLTARSNWLRAINYYQAAVSPLDLADKNHQAAIASMRECAGHYLQHSKPSGEVVSIPWPGGYPLEGYFLPPPAAGSVPAHALICMGEPGQRKDEYLFKSARHAR